MKHHILVGDFVPAEGVHEGLKKARCGLVIHPSLNPRPDDEPCIPCHAANRVEEARGEIATAIGFFRLHFKDAGIEVEGPYDRSEPMETTILRRMWATLDRLDRAWQGEDYIEKWEAFRKQYPDQVSPLGVPESALPGTRPHGMG